MRHGRCFSLCPNSVAVLIKAAAAVVILHALTCSPLSPPTPFEFIEETRIRPVGMVISPFPEGAPGDTLRICAHFAGKPITAITGIGVVPSDAGYAVDSSIAVLNTALHLPDSAEFSFRIPDNALDGKFAELFSGDSIDETESVLLRLLRAKNFSALQQSDSVSLAKLYHSLIILCTRPHIAVTVRAPDGEELCVQKDFVVRYNSKLQEVPALAQNFPVNHNPPLRFVALYKSRSHWQPWAFQSLPHPAGTVVYLQSSLPELSTTDTIEIDTGYYYYFGTDWGRTWQGDPPGITDDDSAWDSMAVAFAEDPDRPPAILYETFQYQWYYQVFGGSAVVYDEKMALQRYARDAAIEMFPPLDLGVTGCRIWVKIMDYFPSCPIQSTGTSQTSVRCYFKYTDAYRRAHGG